jgi:ribosome-binding factor A
MPASHFHIDRLREQLQHEIAAVIAREMRDPRIPSVVTVTQVKLAPDTRNATVFVSVLGDATVKAEALKALTTGGAYIQRLVSARITVKHFPHLVFRLDESIEHSQHINELLKEISDDLEQPSQSD